MKCPRPQTIILRHRKENLKKCSLRGLESRPDFVFLTYPIDPIPDLERGILLDLDASLLSKKERGCSLLLIDGTWKQAALMERQLPNREKWIRRSLPSLVRTAYPRKQTGCPFPQRGLASVEALYIAHLILGYEIEGLLDHYYWKERFLRQNASVLMSDSLL